MRIIIEISSQNVNSALVEVVGVRRHVDLGLLEDDRPNPGDWVLIHVGYAMSKISEQDAAEQMRTLEMLGESEAAMQEIRGYGLEETEANLSPQTISTLDAPKARNGSRQPPEAAR